MNTPSKVALVTGATRGIGLETVRQLATQGVMTLLGGRDAVRTEDAAASLREQGLPVTAITIDVTDADSIAKASRQVQEEYGRLDILVNNAGISLDDAEQGTSGQPMSVWRDTLETNLLGVIGVTNAFLPLLKQSEAGRIVNVSSILGSLSLHSDPDSEIYAYKIPAYDVSKSALNAYTVHLAYELKDSAIKVNAIHPGSVKTDMNEHGELDLGTGARSSVAMALLDDQGPTGSFTHLSRNLPW